MTTWLCSCGSGASASRTPRAVVCRYSAATTSRAGSSNTCPWERRRTVGTVSVRCAIVSLTAAACAASISRRWDSSASAHTADTDFGALNVRSIPPPRAPLEPASRSQRPVRGCLPSISAMKSRPSTVEPSMPRRASVSGEVSHWPGAWGGSRRGRGSSRRALAARSLTPGSARSRRPWRRQCWQGSSQRVQTPTAPDRPTNWHSVDTAPAQRCI